MHSEAHGLAGTHMSGSERYECEVCGCSVFKTEGEPDWTNSGKFYNFDTKTISHQVKKDGIGAAFEVYDVEVAVVADVNSFGY